MLHAHGVSLSDLGVGQATFTAEQSAGGVPAAVLALEGLPRHAGQVLVRVRACRHLRHRRGALAPRPPTRSTTRSPQRWRPPSSGRGPCTSGSRSSSSPPPTTRATTCAHHQKLAGDPTWTRQGRPDLPPRQVPRAGHARRGTAWSTARRGRRHRHRQLCRAGSRRWRTGARSSRPHGAVSTDHSHRDARVEPLDGRRGRAALRAGPRRARSPSSRVTRCVATSCSQQARMAAEDGLVMTMHPAVYRNHHAPTFETVRRRRRRRHPDGRRVHQRSATDAGRVRHLTRTSRSSFHHRRDRLLPRAGAAGRVLPVGLRRGALVVHRLARGDGPLPQRGHRVRRVHTNLRLHRRHPGLPVDPGTPRHQPPDGLGLPRRGSSPTTGSRMDEALDTAHDLVVTNPRKAFKL